MPSYGRAVVISRKKWNESISELDVRMDDGSLAKALSIDTLVGSAQPGDTVVLNTTAVELRLGSGGYHFVVWNLSRPTHSVTNLGHIMKLRYTPLQLNVEAIEEIVHDAEAPPEETKNALSGMPVIAGSVHSQLLPAVITLKHLQPQAKILYVMTDGGCLPAGFSRTVGFLKENGDIDAVITTGHAFGGDFEAVTLAGALSASRKHLKADVAVVIMGPGIVGTGSALGFTGLEQADIINCAWALGGKPIGILRISFADPRSRHRGVSHHSISVLSVMSLARAFVGVPKLEDDRRKIIMSQLEDSGIKSRHEVREVDCSLVLDLLKECDLKPSSMGRGLDDDPEFFMAAGAAGILASDAMSDPQSKANGECDDKRK